MKKLLLVICVLSMGSLGWAQSAPPLGSAQSFAVLGASAVTNTGPTVITGDLGVSPGTSVTGFPPGTVTGGTVHAGDAPANAGQAAAHTAYAALAAEHCGTNLTGKTLGTSPGAVTLSPGVYCFASSAQLTGTLTLNGSGVYIFKIGTTLTTASKSSVVLAKGATAGNVFWQVGSSATLGTNTAFEGSILANISGTVNHRRQRYRPRLRPDGCCDAQRKPHSRRIKIDLAHAVLRTARARNEIKGESADGHKRNPTANPTSSNRFARPVARRAEETSGG